MASAHCSGGTTEDAGRRAARKDRTVRSNRRALRVCKGSSAGADRVQRRPANCRPLLYARAGGRSLYPAKLSLPVGAVPFPAVVLVHGSGPNDRDETVGQLKPFRDLAWGLASRNVAVLRYEKRTKAHAGQMAAQRERLTVKEEVVDDALAAVARLCQVTTIDLQRIFVLGHSLVGTLIPRIGKRGPHL